MSVHPVAEAMLRRMPWLSVVRAPLRERGRYYREHEAVLIRHGLRGGEYNATLVHEAIHAERGDEPCVTPELEARQEAAVSREAARRLISLDALVHHLLWTIEEAELAEDLGVDVEMVLTRLRCLTPQETAYIEGRIASEERGIA